MTKRRDTISRITYQRFFVATFDWLQERNGHGGGPRTLEGFWFERFADTSQQGCIAQESGLKVFSESDRRWNEVPASAMRMSAAGRAVLIGTRSVAASELISQRLFAAGLPHEVLNARQDVREAEIIAAGGQPGRITVATNMAGRGTDILLEPEVRARGGLHVILTEYHD